jgi:Sel1 repeat
MPKASELPENLKGLARRQGTEVSSARFEADVEKLTIALGSILDERRRRDATEAAEKVAETRRSVEPEAVRQKENQGSTLFSAISLIEARSAPRSPQMRTYSPIIVATIAIGVAAALAILVATFGSTAWKFSAPAGDKAEAEQAAADKAEAEQAAADKAEAEQAAADKAAANRAPARLRWTRLLPTRPQRTRVRPISLRRTARTRWIQIRLADAQMAKGGYVGAMNLYRQAADQGSDEAQAALGSIYRNGLVRPPDLSAAIKWYKIAAAQGNGTATITLNELHVSPAVK